MAAAPAAAAETIRDFGLDGYYVVGPATAVARVMRGDAARVCAPDVDALPSNLTHYRPPADEIARSLSVDFCEAAVVDGAAVDAVIADAAAMRFPVEARALDGAGSPHHPGPVAATPAPTPSAGASPVFAEAYEALAAGEPEAAAALFVRGLEREPSDHSAHYYLGSAYEQIGRADYAAVQYRRVIRNWPGTAEATAAAAALERVETGATSTAAGTAPDDGFLAEIARSIGAIFEPSPGDAAARDDAPVQAGAAAPPADSGRFERAEIRYGDGARYVGGVLDDQPHGEGEMTYADGGRYAGGFRDGLRHGQGRLVLSDGLVYEGQFVDDVIDGRGRLAWPDGSVYEGEFRASARTGEGSYRWPSGSRYEGRFDDGVIVGPGVFLSSDGARYEGEFREGRRTGKGMLTTPDGVRLEGEFVDGQLVRPN